jgi:hypothetical protein
VPRVDAKEVELDHGASLGFSCGIAEHATQDGSADGRRVGSAQPAQQFADFGEVDWCWDSRGAGVDRDGQRCSAQRLEGRDCHTDLIASLRQRTDSGASGRVGDGAQVRPSN